MLDVKEALLQDLLTEYKKTLLLLEGQVAQLREQSCKELILIYNTRSRITSNVCDTVEKQIADPFTN